ncbi:MAG: hypothetical protein WCH04_06695 [Gammaproteobacteria bacterium]
MAEQGREGCFQEQVCPSYRFQGIIINSPGTAWSMRVTMVFARHGQYAHDRKIIAQFPPADLTVECIGDLLDYDLVAQIANQQSVQITREATK